MTFKQKIQSQIDALEDLLNDSRSVFNPKAREVLEGMLKDYKKIIKVLK